MHRSEVIEDLLKFIEDQQEKLDPILMCGEQRMEKTKVLDRLAFQAKSSARFKLVLYLQDCHRCHQHTPSLKDTKKAAQEFQTQVFASLANLVPKTIHKYGLDAIKAVVKAYQKNILFVINWNVWYGMYGSVQSEMQHGTWLITCNTKIPPQGTWQVLRLKTYTKYQVEKMLHNRSNSPYLLECYNSFDNKDILCSMDMIQVFCEMSETISPGNDFEIVESYVLKNLESLGNTKQANEKDLLRLGKLAFDYLYNRKCGFNIKGKDISNIQKCICESFLLESEGMGWHFKHSVVGDFLAAKYVVSDPSVACKNWVKDENNVVAFKRVFKFVCFMWFQGHSIKKENLNHMETFLRTLLCVPEKGKTKHRGRKGRTDEKNYNCVKKWGTVEDDNKHKNPFDDWDFLLDLDNACTGEAMKLIVSILSDIPCWCFNISDSLTSGKFTRLEKILGKVSLHKDDPVIIKLKSNCNITFLTELWRKLSGVRRLYECVNIMVTIEGDDASYLSHKEKLENFFKTLSATQIPLNITRYKGPLFLSQIPSFFKCRCMHALTLLEVVVYDVKSLSEVMACSTLLSLEEVFIEVNLELVEQITFNPSSIEFPDKIPVHITFTFFLKIQELLDSFRSCDRLCSLSIHGLYLLDGFKLDLSKFSNLKSLNLRCEPQLSEDQSEVVGKDVLEVPLTHRLPRCHWVFLLLNGLSLPQKVERLLLRNVEFFNDSNQGFINHFFKKYNIDRLLLLDTQLSLTGAGNILCSQTENEDEDIRQQEEKRLKRNEPQDTRKLAARRKRIPRDKREALKWTKPSGKELVVTSEGSTCADCSCFPCMCLSKVDRANGCNSYKKMIQLINDVYYCNVQTFSYSFNHCTVRKDMCGDLRVECVMKCLTDTVAFDLESKGNLTHFFLSLMHAQCICITLEQTSLSPAGVEKLVEFLTDIKSEEGDGVERFSIIVETTWHPIESTSLNGIKQFLEMAEYLSVVHYRCCCSPKCFHVKKTYQGEITDVIQAKLH